jgi:putative MATE family efflux protein
MDEQSAFKRSDRLLEGPVGRTVISLTLPVVFGLAAIVLFGIVDTFYVGRLGATELAAMSFTFPVAFFVMSIAIGLGMGVTSVISRAIGEGDHHQVRRLTTDGLILANSVVVIFAAAGLLSIGPLFGLMGADPDMVSLIATYMAPWYLGVGLLVIPIVGNAAIRSTGDTKTPSVIMIIAGAVNIVLDPLLIFGPGPFPRLELFGAALATVISWTVTFTAALWILGRRERMLDLSIPRPGVLWNSWRRILYVGLPAAGTSVMIPLSNGILTRMVAMHGSEAVAAFGVGTRLQSLSVIGISAMAISMTPFVGQNFGADICTRVREGVRFAVKASLLYGAVVALVLGGLSRPLATLFNSQPAVITATVRFLLLVPVSYGLYGIAMLSNSVFNAVNKPMRSAFLIVLRVFVLAVPLAYAGSVLGGAPGIFGAISIANILTGMVALVMVRRFLGEAEAAMGAKIGYLPDGTVARPLE